MDLETEPLIGGHPAADWRVLLIEDAVTFQVLVRSVLEQRGFQVTVAGEGRSGLDNVRTWQPDVVLLDLGLPDLDGMRVCKEIRSISDAFVIMLTGRDDDESRFSGLQIGADAYVTKPFENRELILAIEVLLRRSRPNSGIPDHVRFGSLTIDPLARQVTVGEELVRVTKIELTLLEALISAAGQIVSRDDLMACLWGPGWTGDDHVISVHIANLRKKIDPQPVGRIETIRGVGYRLLDL